MNASEMVILQNNRGDFWCGQFGWFEGVDKALPMTNLEASIRVTLEVCLGARAADFRTVIIRQTNEA